MQGLWTNISLVMNFKCGLPVLQKPQVDQFNCNLNFFNVSIVWLQPMQLGFALLLDGTNLC